MFNMKWKKNQFGGRKVVQQATMLAHSAQKVDGLCPIGSTTNLLDINNLQHYMAQVMD